jgi:hypothetical protein
MYLEEPKVVVPETTLFSKLSMLDKKIAQLNESLQPVLRDSNPSDEKAETSSTTLFRRLDNISDRLEDILSRIEL